MPSCSVSCLSSGRKSSDLVFVSLRAETETKVYVQGIYLGNDPQEQECRIKEVELESKERPHLQWSWLPLLHQCLILTDLLKSLMECAADFSTCGGGDWGEGEAMYFLVFPHCSKVVL